MTDVQVDPQRKSDYSQKSPTQEVQRGNEVQVARDQEENPSPVEGRLIDYSPDLSEVQGNLRTTSDWEQRDDFFHFSP